MEILARLKTNKFLEYIMLKELLSDIISVDDVLLVVKSNGATSEMRSNSLSIRPVSYTHLTLPTKRIV